MIQARAVLFSSPGQVEIRSEELAPPGRGQALVRTLVSGISAGTELLILAGLAPPDMPADASLPSLPGSLRFPIKYGYAAVGRVEEVGADTDGALVGRLVFSFHPHQSAFVTPVETLLPLPDGVSPEAAIFLPNLETAIGLIHDAAPLLGERVAVFGQGVVGLLVTALLGRLPLERLVSLDRYPLRRDLSLGLGAQASLDPAEPDSGDRLRVALGDPGHPADADLCLELSGNPQALDLAIAACAFSGRVVVGSWYGRKRVSLDLGDRFHRGRIRLISSQVSSIDPTLRGRWSQRRRWRFALSLLPSLPLDRWITHRLHFESAPEAYAVLTDRPAEALQVVLRYDEALGG